MRGVKDMGNIRIVTDSTADIPKALADEYGIVVVPLKVHLNDQTFSDGVDLTAQDVFDFVEKSAKLPTTSQPSPVHFLENYQRLLAEPDTEILSIHLSSALSGTFQSACMARNMLGEEQERVTVLDSRSAAFGIGLLAAGAAEAAAQGKSRQECAALIERLMEERAVYFLIDTLDYIRKGGRIGKAAALAGTLLKLKPILSLDASGEIYPVEKAHGSKRALIRIADRLQEQYGEREIDVTMVYAGNREPAEQMFEAIQKRLNLGNVQYTELNAVVAIHVGPGVAAVIARPVEL